MNWDWLGQYIEGCAPCSAYYEDCCFNEATTLEVAWNCDCLSLDTNSLCGSYDRTDIYQLVSLTAITGGWKFRWEYTENGGTSFVEFYASTDWGTENSDAARTGLWKYNFVGQTMPHWLVGDGDFICTSSCECDEGLGCLPVPTEFDSGSGSFANYFFEDYNHTFTGSVSRVANVRPINCDSSSTQTGANDACSGFSIGWKI